LVLAGYRLSVHASRPRFISLTCGDIYQNSKASRYCTLVQWRGARSRDEG
jgi:hypothetical protein